MAVKRPAYTKTTQSQTAVFWTVTSDAGTAWTCDAGVAVGDCVYISAANTVDVADGDDINKLPAIGIVSSKVDATNCVVKDTAFTTFTRSPVFVANRIYYVGLAGALYAPAEDPGGTSAPTYWQPMGRGRASDEILLAPGPLQPILN